MDQGRNNVLQLDFTPYMQIYSVVNVENLKLHDHPMIMGQYEHVQVPYVDEFAHEYLNELQEDVILDKKVRSSRRGDMEILYVGLKEMHPSKA